MYFHNWNYVLGLTLNLGGGSPIIMTLFLLCSVNNQLMRKILQSFGRRHYIDVVVVVIVIVVVCNLTGWMHLCLESGAFVRAALIRPKCLFNACSGDA